jgi:hypothetical protein
VPKYRPLPTLDRLSELLKIVEIPEDKYGEWSGLVWKVRRGGKANAGSVAGSPSPDPTNPDRVDWVVRVDGVLYYASRVIYFMAYGKDPGDVEVDHEDQNWLNNNAWNLRLDVAGDIQQVNSPMQRNNTSGVVGVVWYKEGRKWRAKVKEKHLGYFTCKIEAAHVVNEKWKELGWLEIGRKPCDLETIACDCEKCYPAGKTT